MSSQPSLEELLIAQKDLESVLELIKFEIDFKLDRKTAIPEGAHPEWSGLRGARGRTSFPENASPVDFALANIERAKNTVKRLEK